MLAKRQSTDAFRFPHGCFSTSDPGCDLPLAKEPEKVPNLGLTDRIGINKVRSVKGKSSVALLALGIGALLVAPPSRAVTFPDGFEQEIAFSGLDAPTTIRFAPDGRVFVGEKSGRIKIFDDLSDTTPDLLADLGLAVHDFWDRGVLGMAVDPDFPASPYVYLLYAYNFDANDPGAGMPRWPDSCPDPPGATDDGCVINGRLSRLEVAPDNSLVGSEQVLIENRWCQQYPSHSTGDLAFDPIDRVLYVSAGDGASFNWVDYGQGGGSGGVALNPCGDSPAGVGGVMTPPSAEGGALRSQDIRTGTTLRGTTRMSTEAAIATTRTTRCSPERRRSVTGSTTSVREMPVSARSTRASTATATGWPTVSFRRGVPVRSVTARSQWVFGWQRHGQLGRTPGG
jgi:hypothetical protein